MQDLFSRVGSITDVNTNSHFSPEKVREQIRFYKNYFEKNLTIKPGDRIILQHGNTSKFFFQLFAVWELQLVAVPLSQNLTPVELNEVAELTSAIAIVSENKLQEFPRTSKTELSDESLILFSSGSTAVPKGVVISSVTIESKLTTLSKHIARDEIQNTLCMIPTHFGHGLIGNSLFPLLNGGNLFILPALEFNTARNLRYVISEHKINFLSSVPSFWPMILSGEKTRRSESLKRIHCASAPLSESISKQILEWSPSSRFLNVFGTTETLSWIGASELDRPCTETRIHEFWGAKMSIDAGEVVIETQDLFSYYVGGAKRAKDAPLVFRTGDSGTQDANGDIVIIGRLNDIINVGGTKVSPEEIESALLENGLVKETCCFGVPDQWAGERVAAVIVLRETALDSAIAKKLLNEFLISRLSSHKIPAHFLFFKELPRSDRGKISRQAVKKKFLETPT